MELRPPQTALEATKQGLDVSIEANFISKEQAAQMLSNWLKPTEKLQHGD